MAKIAWPINVNSGSPSYDAAAFRQSESVWHTPHSTGTSRPLGAWSGRRPNAWVTTVSGLALTIQPGSGVLDVQTPTATGAYRCSSDAVDTSLTANAAHATLERIDGVYVTVDDTDVDGSGLRNWVFAYVAGTAATAGTQVPPTTPVRSLRIATVNVPHSGSGSLTITMEPVFTVAAGGVLPCLSTARPASPYVGQTIFEIDTLRCAIWDGSVWRDAAARPLTWNFIGAAGSVFGTGVVDTDATETTIRRVAFTKDSLGFTVMRGLASITGPKSSGFAIINLPAGFRTSKSERFVTGGSGVTVNTVLVNANGDIALDAGIGSGTYFMSFSGVRYYADS